MIKADYSFTPFELSHHLPACFSSPDSSSSTSDANPPKDILSSSCAVLYFLLIQPFFPLHFQNYLSFYFFSATFLPLLSSISSCFSSGCYFDFPYYPTQDRTCSYFFSSAVPFFVLIKHNTIFYTAVWCSVKWSQTIWRLLWMLIRCNNFFHK